MVTNVGLNMTTHVGFNMPTNVDSNVTRKVGFIHGHVYCLSGKRSRFIIFSCFSRTVTPGIYPGFFYFFWICFGGPIHFYLEQSHQVPGFFSFFRVEHLHVDQILFIFLFFRAIPDSHVSVGSPVAVERCTFWR